MRDKLEPKLCRLILQVSFNFRAYKLIISISCFALVWNQNVLPLSFLEFAGKSNGICLSLVFQHAIRNADEDIFLFGCCVPVVCWLCK